LNTGNVKSNGPSKEEKQLEDKDMKSL